MGVGVITLRPFEEADVAAVAALEAACRPRPWSERIFADELAAENRIYLVAEEDGLVVGYAGVMLVGEEAHVTNLLVAPEHRRRGVATRLMSQLVRAAVVEGARHLTLEVQSNNEVARRLYSRLGLAPVGVRPGYYGDDDALILWAHDIDRPEFLESLA